MHRPPAASSALLALGAVALIPLVGCNRPTLARAGAIEVTSAYAYPTAGEVGAAYVTLRNTGAPADTLLGATGPDSGALELMETAGQRMHRVTELAIPPKTSVEMAPGGVHVMADSVAHPWRIGDTVRLRLRLARAGALEVAVPVIPYGERP
jgi:copper(I)-binding protein